MGLFGGDDEGFASARRALQQNKALYNDIDLPEYLKYSPELYGNETANYETTEADPLLKSKQLEALAQFDDLSHEGLSDADKAGFSEARSAGDQMAKSKTDAILQSAQSKGVGGGGMEFALREGAAQEASQRAHEMMLQQQQARAAQRAQYLQAYAGQLNTQSGQANAMNTANTNIINDFNRANTGQRNAVNNANVDQRNSAFKYNEGTKDKNYQNQLGKADRISGQNNQGAKIDSAEEERRRQQGGAVTGAIGTGIGAIFGGAGGAQLGGQIGKSLY